MQRNRDARPTNTVSNAFGRGIPHHAWSRDKMMRLKFLYILNPYYLHHFFSNLDPKVVLLLRQSVGSLDAQKSGARFWGFPGSNKRPSRFQVGQGV